MQTWNSSTNNWNVLPPAYEAVKVAVENAYSNNYFYWINNQQQIFKNNYPSIGGIQMPGSATDIAVNGDGEIYIISTTPAPGSTGDFIIKRWDGSNWVEFSSIGAVKIAVGSGYSNSVAIINNAGDVFLKDENQTFFYQAAGVKATSIALLWSTGSPGSVLFITTNQADAEGNYQIKRWTGYDWYDCGFTAKSITTDNFGHPWVVKQNGDIYRNLTL